MRAAFLALAFSILLAGTADAHSGRRFLVQVAGTRLIAQGINTGPADGAPSTRPYANAIHDHWRNVAGLDLATANLPGFDVPARSDIRLWGQRLDLELRSVSKWVNPPHDPAPGTVPNLTPLSTGELVTVNGPLGTVTSDNPGVFGLVQEVSSAGSVDLDLLYEVNRRPADEIFVLEMILSATPPTGPPRLSPSAPIYVILSPDGADHHERLHDASLYLERYLTSAVPEPGTVTLASVAALAVLWCRRRASR